MNIALFLGLLFLTLLQVTVLPLNMGFVAVFALFLFVDKFSALVWVIIFSLLLALFANLNFGLVLVALTTSLFSLDFIKVLIPENRLTYGLLVIAAFPVSTFSLLFLSRILR